MRLSIRHVTTIFAFAGALANAGCFGGPSDSEHPGTGTCDGGAPMPPPDAATPPPDGPVASTDALQCDQLSTPLLPPMSDGQVLTYGQLRTLCCYLPEHFPRITLSSTNPSNVALMDAALSLGPTFEEVRDELSFCQPSILGMPESAPSSTTVGAAKSEIWQTEQDAIVGTPVEQYLSGVPLDTVVHIEDANSIKDDYGPPSSSPLVSTDPSGSAADTLGTSAHNAAYISVGLSAIYYGFLIFRNLQLMGSGPLPGEMAQPAAGAMAVLKEMNIMAIEPAAANAGAAANFLQVVGESCRASQPGVRAGNSSLYSRCWGFVGTTTYSWNAGLDFRYNCQKTVQPDAGVFNGQEVAIWFTRQLTPTVYNYWKRSTAQAWPGAKFYNLLPDVVDWGRPATKERGVNAALRYEYNCVGWIQQPTYSYTSYALAFSGGAGFAAAQ